MLRFLGVVGDDTGNVVRLVLDDRRGNYPGLDQNPVMPVGEEDHAGIVAVGKLVVLLVSVGLDAADAVVRRYQFTSLGSVVPEL